LVSKKLFLIIFAAKGTSDNSDILKNAIATNINKINTANTIPINLDHDFAKLLKMANAMAIPAAKRNNCKIETVSGQILKVMPANNHFLIFLG